MVIGAVGGEAALSSELGFLRAAENPIRLVRLIDRTRRDENPQLDFVLLLYTVRRNCQPVCVPT